MRVSLPGVVLAACSVAACGGGPGPRAGSTASAAAGAEFGVAECDEYIKKYTACIDSKVPESARAMVKQQLDQTRNAWTQAAATAEGKSALASGCRQATEMAKTAMQAYGCSW